MQEEKEEEDGKRIVFTVSAVSWQLNFIGRLFPASRVNDPLFLSLFPSAFKLFFSHGFSSGRIPSKNKRVPPAWFLQSREKGTFVVVIVVVVVLIRAMQPSRLQSACNIRDCKQTRITRYQERCEKNLIGENDRLHVHLCVYI